MGNIVGVLALLLSAASFVIMFITLFEKRQMCRRRIACRLIKTTSIVVGLIGFLAAAGQLFDAPKLHHWMGTVGMALNTALCLLLLSVCVGWLAHLVEQHTP